MEKNRIKRHMVLLFFVCTLLGIFSSYMVFADETASMTVGSATAELEQTVSLAVSLQNLPDEVAGVVIKIVSYDKTKLELVSVENQGLLKDFVSENKHILTWGTGLSKCNTGKSGTAAVLNFKLLDDSVAETLKISVSVEAYDMNVNDIPFSSHNVAGKITVKVHEHEFDEWNVTKEPNCTEDGEKYRSCKVKGCKKVEKVSIDKLGHTYTGKEEITKEADCVAEGSKKVYCSAASCNEYKTVAIPAKGHVKGEIKAEKEATCTEAGKTVVLCNVCREVISTKVIDALGHEYGELVEEVEATCTEDGYGYKICERCEDSKKITLDALGHKFGKTVVEREASCTEDGYGHKPCERCDEKKEIKYEKLGHEYGEVIISVEPTCNEKGTSYRPCIRCEDSKDDTEIPALGHEYGELVVEIEATCIKTGAGYKPCIRCNDMQLVEIPVLGHKYNESIIVIEPTFSEEGKSEAICELCKDNIIEILPKLSETHTHIFSEEKKLIEKATCEKKGIMHMACTVEDCDAYKVIEIPIESHSFGQWSVTKEPTEEEEGIKARTCAECHSVEEISIEKLPKTMTPELVGNEKNNNKKEYDWGTIGVFTGVALLGISICILSFLNFRRR